MNIPNILTCSRFLISFFMVYCIFKEGGQWAWAAFLLFLLGSLTDYLDGYLARKSGKTSQFGAIVDPLADKTLTLCAFVSFWKLDLLPGLWVAIVALRDILVTGFRLFSLGKKDPSSTMSGKGKTAFQMLYISLVLAYLAVSETDFWNSAWDDIAYQGIRLGMLGVVLLVIWSGVEILRRRSRA